MIVFWKVRLIVMFIRLDFIIVYFGCDVGDICVEVEKVVGWVRNYYFGMFLFDFFISNGKFMIFWDRLYIFLCEYFFSFCI